jgi:hypothetical protein
MLPYGFPHKDFIGHRPLWEPMARHPTPKPPSPGPSGYRLPILLLAVCFLLQYLFSNSVDTRQQNKVSRGPQSRASTQGSLHSRGPQSRGPHARGPPLKGAPHKVTKVQRAPTQVGPIRGPTQGSPLKVALTEGPPLKWARTQGGPPHKLAPTKKSPCSCVRDLQEGSLV